MYSDFNYKKLRPLDVFCTSASSLTGRLIRLGTACLKNRSGIIEATRQQVANHCAIVISLGDKLWVAEMVDDGLKINSCRKYLNNKKEKIVAVKRHKKLSQNILSVIVNDDLVRMCQGMRDYDWKLIAQYFGLGRNDKSKYYCSELCEVLANKYDTTWDRYQLKRRPAWQMISPIEIQFGAPEYSDFVHDIYVE